MPLARRLLTASSSSAALLLLSVSTPASCHHVAARNVTAILSARRDLAEFSRALAATGLADAVNNAKDAVMVLAVDDARMAKACGLPREALRRALSRHVLAGYHDDASLRRLLTLTGAKDVVVAPALLDDSAGNGGVEIVARQGQRVAFVPLDNARAAAAFYVGPVVQDAPRNNVSVLLVSGIMWGPAAAHPDTRLLLTPSTAPAPTPVPPDLGPSSRAGASRLVSPDAVTSTTQTQFQQAPINAARSSSATAPRGGRVAFAPLQDAVLPAQQVACHTQRISAAGGGRRGPVSDGRGCLTPCAKTRDGRLRGSAVAVGSTEPRARR